MDRALKERIIGAMVLVLFVVLVVPVFLDGPPDDSEIVTEHVSLPGQSDQKAQTVVLERDRKDPVPAANNDVAAQEPPLPDVVVARQEPVREPASSPPLEVEEEEPVAESAEKKSSPVTQPPPIVSTTGMWAVQLGSFGNQENAERLAADLRKQGFAAFLSQLSTGSDRLHRVRIGPQKDRESAEAMAERLAKAGHQGQVVPHP